MPHPDVDVQHAAPGELEARIAKLRRYVASLARRPALRVVTLEEEFGVKRAAQMRRQAAERDVADHGRLGADY
jgi:hypothetical protein